MTFCKQNLKKYLLGCLGIFSNLLLRTPGAGLVIAGIGEYEIKTPIYEEIRNEKQMYTY